MSSDHLDPELRAVRAALSLLVGYALPEPVASVGEANGVAVGGWVFPPRPVSLVMPELSEPGQLAPRGWELHAQAEQAGVRMLVPGDPGWPSGTACDELPCLWVSGDADLAGLLRQAVTVTGTKACDAYGRHVAGELAYSLSSLGWTIVAADGYGIDLEAASKAHAAGGRVVLVSAGGVVSRVRCDVEPGWWGCERDGSPSQTRGCGMLTSPTTRESSPVTATCWWRRWCGKGRPSSPGNPSVSSGLPDTRPDRTCISRYISAMITIRRPGPSSLWGGWSHTVPHWTEPSCSFSLKMWRTCSASPMIVLCDTCVWTAFADLQATWCPPDRVMVTVRICWPTRVADTVDVRVSS